MAAGADALGLNFVAGSPRWLEVQEAAGISAGLPAFISRVGLFVNAPAAEVRAVLDRVALELLQFHGEESEDYCRSFGKPYIKALRVRSGSDMQALLSSYPSADLLLLDTYSEQGHGGTGEQFAWQQYRGVGSRRPLSVAGGLTPDNVAEAIRLLLPFAVDVSSGVERARGVKSKRLIEAFMRQLRLADRGGHG